MKFWKIKKKCGCLFFFAGLHRYGVPGRRCEHLVAAQLRRARTGRGHHRLRWRRKPIHRGGKKEQKKKKKFEAKMKKKETPKERPNRRYDERKARERKKLSFFL